MKILGIESSCDDTGAAVVTDSREILSNIVWSQLKAHLPYGGVVPEIAARAHIEAADHVIEAALETANCSMSEIDLIAATAGPGLIGGVMVGLMTAKSLSLATGIPYIGVNHLEGHALTVRLTEEIELPYLLLLISGGHCQWIAVGDIGEYKVLGATLDDALGEAFDKTAKMLGLPYPGGPEIEKLAHRGNASALSLPRPLYGKAGCDFSFSGLKTAVRQHIQQAASEGDVSLQDKADICAAFQKTAAECLQNRLTHAIKAYETSGYHSKQLVVAGGVAANQALRAALEESCAEQGYSLHCPPIALCTDNAAMIAWAGFENFRAGKAMSELEEEPRARWPLAS